MALIPHVWPLGGLPTEPAAPSQYWIDRGLRSLYILDQGNWRTNLVTGEVGGTTFGTGPTFPDGWLRTTGSVFNGALLAHGLDLNVALPITFVAGWRRISGSVAWSLLANQSNWHGWYGGDTGIFNSANNNSFDGSLTLGGNGNVAVCHAAANDLRGASYTTYAIDTSVAAPTLVNRAEVALGCSRRSASDNAAVAEFTHFAAIQGELTQDELQALADNPGLLFEPLRIWVPASAGAPSLPTLSALTTKPGTLTSTGFTPRVTAS